MSRLEHVLVHVEPDDGGVAGDPMPDGARRIVCGSMTNLFRVRGATLVTPSLRRCGVGGVMRGILIDLATQSGIEVQAADVCVRDLFASNEMSLTSAIDGVGPIRRVGERNFDVGMTTRALMNLLEDSPHA